MLYILYMYIYPSVYLSLYIHTVYIYENMYVHTQTQSQVLQFQSGELVSLLCIIPSMLPLYTHVSVLFGSCCRMSWRSARCSWRGWRGPAGSWPAPRRHPVSRQQTCSAPLVRPTPHPPILSAETLTASGSHFLDRYLKSCTWSISQGLKYTNPSVSIKKCWKFGSSLQTRVWMFWKDSQFLLHLKLLSQRSKIETWQAVFSLATPSTSVFIG